MIKNTGAVAGDEIAQVYIKDMEADVRVPDVKLAGYKRLSLPAGEEKEVIF